MKSQPRPLRALLVEDSEDDALLLVEALRHGGYAPDWQRVETEAALRDALAARRWDVVFCDHSMPQLDTPTALRVLRETGDTATAIVVSGEVREEVAVEFMRLGANDYVPKNNLGQVVFAMERELRGAGLRREREAAALALCQSEERYRVLFDKSPWPMWVYDPKTLRCLAVNEMAVIEYGYTRKEFLGMSLKDLRPLEDVPAFLAYFDRMKAGADALPRPTLRHRKKNGSIIMVEIASQPTTYDGQPAGVVQAIDITARMEAEDALRASEERFRGTFEQAAIGMAHVSTRGRFLRVNDKLCEIVGYGREELMGMTFANLTVPEDRGGGQAAHRAMLAGEMSSYTAEKRYRRKDGETVWASLVTTLERPAMGKAKYFITVIEDITLRKLAEEALRRSEREQRKIAAQLVTERARLVDAQAVAKVGSWETDLSTLAVICSAEMHRIFETAPDQPTPTQRGFLKAVHPEDRAAVEEAFVQSLKHHSPCTVGHRLLMADGRMKFVEERWQVVRDGQGKPVRAIGTCQDTTEQRLAVEALRLSEERFRQMAENSAEVFWMTDPAKKQILYVSPAYETVWGRTCKSLYAKPVAVSVLDTIHPEDKQRVDGAFSLPIAGSFDLTYRIVRPDGVWRWIHHRGYPVKNEAGETYRLAGIATDITETIDAGKQIRDQAALLNHAQDAILVQDLEGKIDYWNKSAERVFGWTAAEARGSKVQELLYESPESYETALAATLSRGDWIGELTKRTKGGGDVVVEGRWTLVRDEAGQPASILAINTDITEKKMIEAQLFRAQRMESIGTLAGGIAHDLNNVLGPIIMAVDLLKVRVTAPQDRRLLEILETSGKRGADMVRQVLFFARGSEGRRVLISPARLVEELQQIARDTFPKSISVEGDVPEDIRNTLGDPTQLHQVLLNLCVNARDAMPRGGGLRISARNRLIDGQFEAMQPEARPGPYVVLEVADTGEGMPPEVVARIFEPFFTTKEIGKGTGLGLSTANAIVKTHGGFMTVESEPGKGTTFQVNLPAESGPAGADTETPPPDLPRGAGETVLLIDDEASIRSITGQTLEAFGYRVISAGDGAEGIAKYAQNTGGIAAVLVDMMMPVMDGAATIAILLRLNPEVKIIVASASNPREVEADPAGAGVKYFLQKPYTAETLLGTLSKVLHSVA